MIDALVAAGHPVLTCCRVLGFSKPGYYRYRRRPASPTQLRRQWLTVLIQEVHLASRGTYGDGRVHAELTLGMNVTVSSRLVFTLMRNAGIYGLPGPGRMKRLRGVVTAGDLVNRKSHRVMPNELWVTDITEHRTREGKVYCCCVMDTYRRKIVGWSIDSSQDTRLVINALDMAIKNRDPAPGGIVHAGHGTQSTSWAFGGRIRRAGLMPSFGSVGDGLESAMMVSFWSSMQIELLNRQGWTPAGSSRTRSSSTSRSSTTAAVATPDSAICPRSSSNYARTGHPSPPERHTRTGNQAFGQVSRSGGECDLRGHDGLELDGRQSAEAGLSAAAVVGPLGSVVSVHTNRRPPRPSPTTTRARRGRGSPHATASSCETRTP